MISHIRLHMKNTILKYRKWWFKFRLPKEVLSLSDKLIDENFMTYKSIFGRNPRSMLEVGSNFSQDIEYACKFWKINRDQSFAIEANPHLFQRAKELFPEINTINMGIHNHVGTLNMHTSSISSVNNGVSSFLSRNDDETWIDGCQVVKVTTIDDLGMELSLPSIDFVKIDVEGLSLEVIEGGKEFLSKVHMIQVECELTPLWKSQRGLYGDVDQLLQSYGFQLCLFKLLPGKLQCEASWVKI